MPRFKGARWEVFDHRKTGQMVTGKGRAVFFLLSFSFQEPKQRWYVVMSSTWSVAVAWPAQAEHCACLGCRVQPGLVVGAAADAVWPGG